MTLARKDLVDEQTPGFYHCTNRCVRRTFLCGLDETTGIDYSHRKDWLEQRMLELCDIFSVEIFAYAVMDNHYHIVLHLDPLAPETWSKETIAERWLKAYPGRLDGPKFAKQRALKKQAIIADKVKLKCYRKRLGSLSWFMARLNEPLAKQSNREDYCTGRFWEGRYSSQALLDEAAVFSCMCYVDLNPVRAKITDKLATSDNTSVKHRLDALQRDSINVQAALDAQLSSLSTSVNSRRLPMNLKDYLELVEWTGQNIIYPNKAALPANIASSLSQLNLQQHHWLKQIEHFNQHYCHVVGTAEQIKAFAERIEKKWLKCISAAKRLFKPPLNPH